MSKETEVWIIVINLLSKIPNLPDCCSKGVLGVIETHSDVLSLRHAQSCLVPCPYHQGQGDSVCLGSLDRVTPRV